MAKVQLRWTLSRLLASWMASSVKHMVRCRVVRHHKYSKIRIIPDRELGPPPLPEKARQGGGGKLRVSHSRFDCS